MKTNMILSCLSVTINVGQYSSVLQFCPIIEENKNLQWYNAFGIWKVAFLQYNLNNVQISIKKHIAYIVSI